MKRNKIFQVKYARYGLILLTGLFLGWLFFHPARDKEQFNMTEAREGHLHDDQEKTIWTCSMHPQIRMEKPGDCPICGMDLIPLTQSGSSAIDPEAIHLSKEAAALAKVLTTVVTNQNPVKEVRLYGKVGMDERLLKNQVAYIPGRIEKLLVNFKGEKIQKGRVLAEIYSPALITAQQELLLTLETRQLQPELYEASKEKLRQWKLSDEQISAIETSGKIINNFQVLSTTSGTVTSLLVNSGDYISEGTVLFEIADLSRVWIMFEAYESDLPFLSIGKKITFTFQALPGTEFSGNISFIDPVIDPVTRIARVRVEAENKSGSLKPEMFATGIVSSNLKEFSSNVIIPRSAVLWTGKRSIVYVKQPGDEPVFRMREVELGPALGDNYVITEGLSMGEEIVTSGTFSVDASAQLEGKPSMMNPASLMNSAESRSDQKLITGLNPLFVSQLNNLYDRYIELKNAFVSSDAEKVRKASATVEEALRKVDPVLASGNANSVWVELNKNLEMHIKAISSSNMIEKQRIGFSGLSDNLYNAIKSLGLMNKTVYFQFCPMAMNDKGAFWLSESEEIRNPYFGDQMLTCGETREIIKY